MAEVKRNSKDVTVITQEQLGSKVPGNEVREIEWNWMGIVRNSKGLNSYYGNSV